MSLFRRTEDPMAQQKTELQHADLSQRRDIADRESEVTTQFQLNTKRDMSDLTRWQQDLEPKIEEFQHYLFGEIKVGGKWVKYADQKLSTENIYNLCSKIRMEINQNTMMTYYEKRDINKRGYNATTSVLSDVLLDEHQRYGTPFPILSDIDVRAMDIVHDTLHRALGGRERKAQTEIRQVKEVHTDNPDQAKRDNKHGWLF